jgi:hypothetical protein
MDGNQAALIQEHQELKEDQVQILLQAAAVVPEDQSQTLLQAATVAAAPPVFALAPGLANTGAYIDFTSTSGRKHFMNATEPLTSQPFDLSDPSDLPLFLALVLRKSQLYGWNPILTIPVTSNAATAVTKNYNLLQEHGLIPLASVKAHVVTYYGTSTKKAQDSFMLSHCLLSSLSLEFRKRISFDSQDYHLPAIVEADGPIPAGPLLLKLIISKVVVDS